MGRKVDDAGESAILVKDASKAKGGHARAEALTPSARRLIAKRAAETRWASARPLKATHRGNFKQDFGIDVDCYVLDDEQKTAVVSQRGMGAALAMGQGGGTRLPDFLKGAKIAPFVGRELAEKLARPLVFSWVPLVAGKEPPPATVHGYDVTILIDICKAILDADADGKLLERQRHIARQAQVVLNASAKAGIKGLVYALAGYDQTKAEIIAAFKLYVRDEARKYEEEFPPELYEEWYRLYQLSKPQRGRPWKFKELTIKHVYMPLAKSNGRILELLRKAQKASESERPQLLHQFLSQVGVKVLRTHLGRLLGMAETARERREYEEHVASKFGVAAQLDLF